MPSVTYQPSNKMYFWTGLGTDPTLQDNDLAFWYVSITPFTEYLDELYFDNLVPEMLTDPALAAERTHIPPWTRKYPPLPTPDTYFSLELVEGACWDKDNKCWYICCITDTNPPQPLDSTGTRPSQKRLFRCSEMFDDSIQEIRQNIGDQTLNSIHNPHYRIREMFLVEVGNNATGANRRKVLVFHESPFSYNTPVSDEDDPGLFPPDYNAKLFFTETDGTRETTFATINWDKDTSSIGESHRIYALSFAPVTYRFNQPSGLNRFGFYVLLYDFTLSQDQVLSTQYKIVFYVWNPATNNFQFDNTFYTGPKEIPTILEKGSGRTTMNLGRIVWSEVYGLPLVPRQIFSALLANDNRTGYRRTVIDISVPSLTVQGRVLTSVIPLPNPHVEYDPGFGDPIDVRPSTKPIKAWEWVVDNPVGQTITQNAHFFVAVDHAGDGITSQDAGIFLYPAQGEMTSTQWLNSRQRICDHPFRETSLPISSATTQFILGPGCY